MKDIENMQARIEKMKMKSIWAANSIILDDTKTAEEQIEEYIYRHTTVGFNTPLGKKNREAFDLQPHWNSKNKEALCVLFRKLAIEYKELQKEFYKNELSWKNEKAELEKEKAELEEEKTHYVERLQDAETTWYDKFLNKYNFGRNSSKSSDDTLSQQVWAVVSCAVLGMIMLSPDTEEAPTIEPVTVEAVTTECAAQSLEQLSPMLETLNDSSELSYRFSVDAFDIPYEFTKAAQAMTESCVQEKTYTDVDIDVQFKNDGRGLLYLDAKPQNVLSYR